jgi:hypothetical protein
LAGLLSRAADCVDFNKLAAGQRNGNFRRTGAPAAAPDCARSIMHDRRGAVSGPLAFAVRGDHPGHEIARDFPLRGCADSYALEAPELSHSAPPAMT